MRTISMTAQEETILAFSIYAFWPPAYLSNLVLFDEAWNAAVEAILAEKYDRAIQNPLK